MSNKVLAFALQKAIAKMLPKCDVIASHTQGTNWINVSILRNGVTKHYPNIRFRPGETLNQKAEMIAYWYGRDIIKKEDTHGN